MEQPLKFSLREKVLFAHEERMETLHSISLEPHVEVQPFEQFVVVKGVLTLYGEYERAMADETEQQSIVAPMMNHVAPIGDLYMFQHDFPIDVTIPRYKVDDIDAIKCTIDSFDYEVEQRLLHVMIDLNITGVHERSEPIPIIEERPTVKAETQPVREHRPTLFHFCQEAPQASQRKIVIVQRDETLAQIAARFDVPLSLIMRWNQLKEETVSVGQSLIVSLQPLHIKAER